MMSIAGIPYLAFTSKLESNSNQFNLKMIYNEPKSISPSMLAHRVSVTNRSVGTHSWNLNTSGCGVSTKTSRACTFIRPVGVYTIRVWTATGDSLTAFVNIIATLSLECVINSCCHIKPLWVIAMVTWWACPTTESRREICATNALVARLNQVTL